MVYKVLVTDGRDWYRLGYTSDPWAYGNELVREGWRPEQIKFVDTRTGRETRYQSGTLGPVATTPRFYAHRRGPVRSHRRSRFPANPQNYRVRTKLDVQPKPRASNQRVRAYRRVR